MQQAYQNKILEATLDTTISHTIEPVLLPTKKWNLHVLHLLDFKNLTADAINSAGLASWFDVEVKFWASSCGCV
jgi:hypothetical protein